MSKKNKSKNINIKNIDNQLTQEINLESLFQNNEVNHGVLLISESQDTQSFADHTTVVLYSTQVLLKFEDDLTTKTEIKTEIKTIDTNVILKELLNNQLKNISIQNKLKFNDIKRISKFLTSSIFDKNNCSLWNGYVTNENNNFKGTYINFYYNKKKIALHRLLYENYVDLVNEDDYIKFTCVNKGKCCNINHLKKFSYNKNDIVVNNNQNLDNNIKINLDKNKLTLEF